MGYRVAVVGATGNVGREMLNILAERRFPASEVIALASARSQGQEISFGDKRLKVQNLENFDFRGVDFALMSAGSGVAREYGEKIGATGCIVVDNSSFWRYHSDVPLIVPEVMPRRSTPIWRAPTARTSSPIRTARRRNWWWR